MATIYGTLGHDLALTGDAGSDLIYGGPRGISTNAENGNDILSGGSGSDTLFGGGGDDILYDSNQFFIFDPGNDRMYGGNGSDQFYSLGGRDIIDGGAGFDGAILYRASATADLTFIMSSPSTVTTLDGDGTTVVNTEVVSIFGGSGDDYLSTGAGNDTLDGGTGRNTLISGAGDDNLYSTKGTPTIDTLDGGAGQDTVHISRYDATQSLTFNMVSTNSRTTLVGNGTTVVNIENIDITTGSGNDRIATGAGKDIISGGSGTNVLNGGAGDDTINSGSYDPGANTVDNIDGGVGNDTATISRGYATNELTFRMSSSDTETVLQGDGTTVVRVENIFITSGSGNDNLSTGAGNDRFEAGTGDNDLNGGDGTDGVLYNFSQWAVVVDLDIGSTTFDKYTDRLTSIENVVGSRFDDVVTGNAKANVIDGGAGGSDTLDGRGGVDTISYAGGFSFGVNVNLETGIGQTNDGDVDVLTSFENIVGSFGNDNLTGNSGANIIESDFGDDVLDGRAGTDQMRGGAGNDNYFVDRSNDKVFENKYEGLDTVTATVSYSLSAGQEIEVLQTSSVTATTTINFIGNEFGNTIIGNAGTNTITGGAGNDALTGGAGRDIFIFNATIGASNIDRITDFRAVDDTIKLENAVFSAFTKNGTIASSSFKDTTDGAKVDADDRILYNHDTGQISYDADGSGSQKAVVFATLDNSAILTFQDFQVI